MKGSASVERIGPQLLLRSEYNEGFVRELRAAIPREDCYIDLGRWGWMIAARYESVMRLIMAKHRTAIGPRKARRLT